MPIDVRPEPITNASELARVSIAFRVERILEVRAPEGGLGGLVLRERSVPAPYVKDYDADSGEGPAIWAAHFDLANWGLILARSAPGGECVGGAAIAFDTPGVHMLEGRRDLAVLWDVRVAPALRGQGLGRRLFRAAEDWARARGCRQLKVETQNINLPACRFYARQGCVLGAVNRFAYPELPDEVQLLWYKTLG